MTSSFSYVVESDLARLRIRLTSNSYIASQTPLAEILPGVTISLSGTEPCVPVEINCLDVPSLLANDIQNKQFARLCGPSLHSFLEDNHYYFDSRCSITVLHDDITAWQLIWLELQQSIVKATSPKLAPATAKSQSPDNVVLFLERR